MSTVNLPCEAEGHVVTRHDCQLPEPKEKSGMHRQPLRAKEQRCAAAAWRAPASCLRASH